LLWFTTFDHNEEKQTGDGEHKSNLSKMQKDAETTNGTNHDIPL
jgi:hypothetical protein